MPHELASPRIQVELWRYLALYAVFEFWLALERGVGFRVVSFWKGFCLWKMYGWRRLWFGILSCFRGFWGCWFGGRGGGRFGGSGSYIFVAFGEEYKLISVSSRERERKKYLFSRIGTPDEALYCLHFQRPRVCKDRARDLGDESRTRGVMKPYGGK